MLDIVEQTPSTLKIQLKDPQCLDMELICLIENDQLCMPCFVENEKSGILEYSTQSYVPLSHFLKQYSFEQEEGYLFLNHLLEDAICANRNKPVLLDPDLVFVSLYGDSFRFLVLPIHIQYWMYRQDTWKNWIQYIEDHFQTNSAYEIPGYIMKFLQMEEASLSNLILGLQEMRKYYYPKRMFKKRMQTFKTSEAIQPYGGYYSLPDRFTTTKEEGTQILTDIPFQDAYLEIDKEKFRIDDDTIIIGRSKTCDISLSYSEISGQHAKVTCKDGKYYIQDLKSKNGTFLNNKRVQRRMRLKDGMQVVLGNHAFIFHENKI